MYLLPRALNQSQLLYGVEKPYRCSMVKVCWRLFRYVPKVYFNAVTLGCPDSRAIVGELKALLIILSHDCIKFFTGNPVSPGGATSQQLIYAAPARIIKSELSFFRLVPEYKTEKLTRSNLIVVHIFKCRCASLRGSRKGGPFARLGYMPPYCFISLFRFSTFNSSVKAEMPDHIRAFFTLKEYEVFGRLAIYPDDNQSGAGSRINPTFSLDMRSRRLGTQYRL